MTDGLSYRLLRAGLAAASGRTYRGLVRACADPRAVQDQVLQRILSDNAGSVFGTDHRFGSIAGFEDYRRAVPVQTSADLREAIERQEATGQRCLTAEQPVYYNQTSGTVAEPKNIPLTKAGLARIQRLQRLAAYTLSRRTAALGGKVFAVTGAAHEGTMPAGTHAVRLSVRAAVREPGQAPAAPVRASSAGVGHRRLRRPLLGHGGAGRG